MSSETRSAAAAGRTLDLFDDHPAAVPAPRAMPRRQGVGGRQRPGPAPAGGGGYLNGRTGSELRADPRLRELAEIGLARHWLAVADIAGYDRFIAMWRLLSADPSLRNDDEQIELHLRPIRAFEKYQRNRYIDTLVTAGLRPSMILQTVHTELGERLSFRHIRRLAAASKQRVMSEKAAAGHAWQESGPDRVAS